MYIQRHSQTIEYKTYALQSKFIQIRVHCKLHILLPAMPYIEHRTRIKSKLAMKDLSGFWGILMKALTRDGAGGDFRWRVPMPRAGREKVNCSAYPLLRRDEPQSAAGLRAFRVALRIALCLPRTQRSGKT